ncbi:MAG TPA: glycine zipper domain-containing protein [Novosphingobium sp.]
MKPTIVMLMAAAALPLSACSSANHDSHLASAAAAPAPRDCRSVGGSALTGAGVGAAAGLGVGALTGGLGLLEGALIGAAVGGLAGAVWADANNDGCADGYIREGRYYEGSPYQTAPAAQPAYRSGERG